MCLICSGAPGCCWNPFADGSHFPRGGRGGYLKRRVTGVSGVTYLSNLLILLYKNKVSPFCIAQSARCNDSELCNVFSPSLPKLRRTAPKVPKNAVRLDLLSAKSGPSALVAVQWTSWADKQNGAGEGRLRKERETSKYAYEL